MTIQLSDVVQGVVAVRRTNEQVAAEYRQFDEMRRYGRLGCMLRAYELTDETREGHVKHDGAAELIGCSRTKITYDLQALTKIVLGHGVTVSDLDLNNPEHRSWADEAYSDVRAPRGPKSDLPEGWDVLRAIQLATELASYLDQIPDVASCSHALLARLENVTRQTSALAAGKVYRLPRPTV